MVHEIKEKAPQAKRKLVAFDERDAKKESAPKREAVRKRSASAVRKPEPGNGQRCTAPKCGGPIEQNTKIKISPKDRDDVRHARCAPATWN